MGVAIALLGGNSALGTTLSGILIGALNYGSQGMQFGAGRAERNHRHCDIADYFLCGSTRNRQSSIAKETIA